MRQKYGKEDKDGAEPVGVYGFYIDIVECARQFRHAYDKQVGRIKRSADSLFGLTDM